MHYSVIPVGLFYDISSAYIIMAQSIAPKQWSLTKDETINTFEAWHQNLLYNISLNNNFALFMGSEFTWQKKTANNPTLGLVLEKEFEKHIGKPVFRKMPSLISS